MPKKDVKDKTSKLDFSSHSHGYLVQLESKLAQQEEITKKAQLDYINLKADFDFLMRQTKAKEQTLEQDTLIKVVKKLLPFVEDLRKSLFHLTDEQKADGLGKGVQMVYDKFLGALAELAIFPIDQINVDVDPQLHEPISMLPTEDKKLKGKIIQIFDQGFVFKKDGFQQVILPSKVVVGG
ncbi:hypothetical protein AGMMS50249_3480 [candidate division SR1 bacterium]|nr:hypothetical protein AGMMS50249_3480 [candidate division SR1 bacterium]